MRILIFGDSIVWGAEDEKGGGWADRLKQFLMADESRTGRYNPVYNLGVSGNRVTDLLARFEVEAKPRIRENQETLVIFSIGTNDSALLNAEKQLWTPFDEFQTSLRPLVEMARKITPNVIFLSLLPCEDKKLDPAPFAPEMSYKSENIQRYNSAINNFCEGEGIGFVNLFAVFSERNYSEFLSDGLHPNSDGHTLIFDEVRDYLLDKKLI